jgi:hypothetical protein
LELGLGLELRLGLGPELLLGPRLGVRSEELGVRIRVLEFYCQSYF